MKKVIWSFISCVILYWLLVWIGFIPVTYNSSDCEYTAAWRSGSRTIINNEGNEITLYGYRDLIRSKGIFLIKETEENPINDEVQETIYHKSDKLFEQRLKEYHQR